MTIGVKCTLFYFIQMIIQYTTKYNIASNSGYNFGFDAHIHNKVLIRINKVNFKLSN